MIGSKAVLMAVLGLSMAGAMSSSALAQNAPVVVRAAARVAAAGSDSILRRCANA